MPVRIARGYLLPCHCERRSRVAISCMKQVQLLFISHAWDCFAVLRTARNDKFRKTVIASGVAARQSHALNARNH